jgi:hypothetical protein
MDSAEQHALHFARSGLGGYEQTGGAQPAARREEQPGTAQKSAAAVGLAIHETYDKAGADWTGRFAASHAAMPPAISLTR